MANGGIACDGTYSECVEASHGRLIESVYKTEEENTKTVKPVTDKENDADFPDKDRFREEDSSLSQTDTKDHEEMKMQGVVRKETFLKYSQAMGGITVSIFLIVLFTATQASVLGTVAVLGIWSEHPAEEQKSMRLFGIVFGLGATVITLSVLRAFGNFALLIKASRVLHDKMIASVLR